MTSKRSHHVRIIAGQWRGRKIPVPDLPGLRPTTDRVRETVFNWLRIDVAGARCLDLFAGTGVLGMECLSRGASFVGFVEQNSEAALAIRNNLSSLTGSADAPNYEVQQNDGLQVLRRPPAGKYDLVFLDPPFDSQLLQPSCDLLEQNQWLSSGSKIYLEQSTLGEIVQVPDKWQQLRSKTAGQSRYTIYQRG